jgi:hypothetical protein
MLIVQSFEPRLSLARLFQFLVGYQLAGATGRKNV